MVALSIVFATTGLLLFIKFIMDERRNARRHRERQQLTREIAELMDRYGVFYETAREIEEWPDTRERVI